VEDTEMGDAEGAGVETPAAAPSSPAKFSPPADDTEANFEKELAAAEAELGLKQEEVTYQEKVRGTEPESATASESEGEGSSPKRDSGPEVPVNKDAKASLEDDV
jgi:hypothetical protein